MRLAVVGLGSMGKRRLRILRAYYPAFDVCGVDSSEERRSEVERDYSINTFATLEKAYACNKLEAVIISSSPLTHGEIAKSALKHGSDVFCELNLDNSWYEAASKIAECNKRHVFLSSTQLYQDDINEINGLMTSNAVPCAYEYHVGQYLPDWHPWEKIDNYFISDIRTNGCRELMAIELPWLDRIFTGITSIKSITAKLNTSLNLSWPDTRIMSVEHVNGTIGSVIIDVVSRIPRRDLHIWGEWGDISWSGKQGTLCNSVDGAEWNKIDYKLPPLPEIKSDMNTKYSYAPIVNEHAYIREIVDFIAIIQGKAPVIQPYSLTTDKRVIDIINSIDNPLIKGA